MTFKSRENRAWRNARKQGLHLEKNRRRDAWAINYKGYQLWDRGHVVAGGLPYAYSMNIDAVEKYLQKHQ